ncbi:MAG: right-handed parallel beta-helix repeat-containing protein [Prolixibacteraceae bacterium]|nr:right-handed parallel beta-helix repeat-containing protein [Prolixibacteraceae bacterium]
MNTRWFISFFLLYVAIGCNSKKENLITSYGAIADGQTNNATFIQKAIDEASAAGGGQVIVPPGNFKTGPVFLKSGVDLHLQLGATLLGPTNRADYGYDPGRPALVSAKNQSNISISGQGIIDGQGQELMLDIFKKLRSGEMKQDTMWLVKRPGGRAFVLNFNSCTNVNISGVTLKNATDWVQDYRECDGVTIDKITVQSTAYWNNDGLDITDSKNVKITNCFINSSDDGICLKSENPDFLCENVFIDSCTVRSSASGFKLGTASVGGFKNIKVRNLTVFDTYRSAIALESVDGGILEDIDIQNVTAKNTGNAIFIRLGHRNIDGKVGTLKRVYIANVKAETPLYKPDQGYPIEGPPDHLKPGFDKMPVRPSHFHIYGHPFLPYNLIPSSIVGLPGHPVQDVTLENIEISYGGMANKEIAHIPLKNITSVPENKANYPEFSMFGELPSWGFYVRHAEGIKMKNVKVNYLKDDFRPALVFDDVKGLELADIDIPTAKEMPVVMFNNTVDLTINNLKMPVSEEKGIVKTSY